MGAPKCTVQEFAEMFETIGPTEMGKKLGMDTPHIFHRRQSRADMGGTAMTYPTFDDLDIAAKTVWAEARGEGELGMAAVAYVIVNRWKRNDGQFRKDDTIANTCKRRFQFSCWLPNDPNLEKMERLTLADKLYRRAMVAVLEAIDCPPDRDITRGATHYHALYVHPFWAEGKTPCMTILHHKFYNDVD